MKGLISRLRGGKQRMADRLFRIAQAMGPRPTAHLVRALGGGRYRGEVIDSICFHLWQVSHGDARIEQAIKMIRQAILAANPHVEFEAWLAAGLEPGRTVRLAQLPDRSRRRKSWRLQLFNIPANTSHPPHGHHDLASVLVVLRGRLIIREYDRLAGPSAEGVLLKPRGERILEVGDSMITPDEFAGNVHWFGAEAEPVTALNFNARGFMPETFYPRNGTKHGRHYLDPTGPTNGEGLILAREIDRKEADARFAGTPLSAFPSHAAD